MSIHVNAKLKKISMILPTRKRINLLINLLKTIRQTTFDISNIEVIIGYDNDDKITRFSKDMIEKEFKFSKFIEINRMNSITSYHNLLFNYTSGDYLIVLNDDCEFLTERWDVIAAKKINDFLYDKNDGIFYGRTETGNPNEPGKFSSFPLLSRKGINVLGYVMHERHPGWMADVHIGELYRACERYVELPEIVIRHVFWLRGGDEAAMNMRAISKRKLGKPNLEQDINKLKTYIKKCLIKL